MKKRDTTNKEKIEINTNTINELMRVSAKKIDSINMLRYQFTSVEPLVLFRSQQEKNISESKRELLLDYTNIRNLGAAYDFILENKNVQIDAYQIHKLYSILSKDTEISSGYRLRMVNVLGQLAPAPEKIYYKLEQILYNLTDERHSVLTRAFDTHFDIIETQPYTDYNKRTARLIMNWFLIQSGYQPIIFNKKSDSQGYTEALHKRLDGDRRAYTTYMEKCMLRTQTEIIKLLKNR